MALCSSAKGSGWQDRMVPNTTWFAVSRRRPARQSVWCWGCRCGRSRPRRRISSDSRSTSSRSGPGWRGERAEHERHLSAWYGHEPRRGVRGGRGSWAGRRASRRQPDGGNAEAKRRPATASRMSRFRAAGGRRRARGAVGFDQRDRPGLVGLWAARRGRRRARLASSSGWKAARRRWNSFTVAVQPDQDRDVRRPGRSATRPAAGSSGGRGTSRTGPKHMPSLACTALWAQDGGLAAGAARRRGCGRGRAPSRARRSHAIRAARRARRRSAGWPGEQPWPAVYSSALPRPSRRLAEDGRCPDAPKAAMLSRTHSSAATWSSSPVRTDPRSGMLRRNLKRPSRS